LLFVRFFAKIYLSEGYGHKERGAASSVGRKVAMFNSKLVISLCEDFALFKNLKECGAYDEKTAKYETISCLKGAANRYARCELDAMGYSIVQNIAMNVLDDEKGFSFEDLPSMARDWFSADFLKRDFLPEWVEANKRIEADTDMLKRQNL